MLGRGEHGVPSFLPRNAKSALLIFRVPHSCIKFAFPRARVPKMPGTRERGNAGTRERGNAKPGTRPSLVKILVNYSVLSVEGLKGKSSESEKVYTGHGQVCQEKKN